MLQLNPIINGWPAGRPDCAWTDSLDIVAAVIRPGAYHEVWLLVESGAWTNVGHEKTKIEKKVEHYQVKSIWQL